MVMDRLIKFHGRIYLIPSSHFREVILKAFHDAPTTGHPGVFKTYRKIREWFTWKGFKDDVHKLVRDCAVCQQSKGEQTYLVGLLQPLPILDSKLGKYFYGLYCRVTMSIEERLHLCDSLPANEVFSLLFYSIHLHNNIDGRSFL